MKSFLFHDKNKMAQFPRLWEIRRFDFTFWCHLVGPSCSRQQKEAWKGQKLCWFSESAYNWILNHVTGMQMHQIIGRLIWILSCVQRILCLVTAIFNFIALSSDAKSGINQLRVLSRELIRSFWKFRAELPCQCRYFIAARYSPVLRRDDNQFGVALLLTGRSQQVTVGLFCSVSKSWPHSWPRLENLFTGYLQVLTDSRE